MNHYLHWKEKHLDLVPSDERHAQQILHFWRPRRTITLFDSFSPYYVRHNVNQIACFTYNKVFKQKKPSFNMSSRSSSTS